MLAPNAKTYPQKTLTRLQRHSISQEHMHRLVQHDSLCLGPLSSFCCFARSKLIHIKQGSPNFLPEGHISQYATVRGLDIFRNVIISGYVAFTQIKKCFVNIIIIHYWLNVFSAGCYGFAGLCQSSRAEFGRFVWYYADLYLRLS